jgi:hypothetical protein
VTLGRSILWFIIGVIWVCAAFAIVYAGVEAGSTFTLRSNDMANNDENQLTERMNSLAGELAVLELNDPRRAEIINEITRLSLLSASRKRRSTDG